MAGPAAACDCLALPGLTRARVGSLEEGLQA
jgi:hypothetical protein